MNAVDLIRRRVLRAMHEVRIYISCLQDREDEALKRLHGQEGVERLGRIADYVLGELGHEVTLPEEAMYSQSRRAAQQVREVDTPAEPEPKKRGRPKRKIETAAA